MPDQRNAFEKIFECSLDGVLLTRPDGAVLRANAAACRALQRTEEEICRAARQQLVEEDASLRELLMRRLAEGSVAGELTFRRPDGSSFPAEFTSGLIPRIDGEALSYVIFRDVTGRRHTEEALRKSNRALRLLTVCNETLVRASTEESLFADVCRAVVDVGGYRMCWVSLADQEATKRLRVVAQCGDDEGCFTTADLVWSDTPRGQGPTGTAVRTGRFAVAHDFENSPAMRPWRDRLLERGCRAAIALPIVFEGRRIGAITVFSPEVQGFEEAERLILEQLSNDLAYGVNSLRARSARERADEALRLNEAMLKGITDAVPDPLFLKDREGRYLFVNPAALERAGKAREQVIGKTDLEIRAEPRMADALAKADRRVMDSGVAEVNEETIELQGGRRVYLTAKIPFRDHEGRIVGVVGAARDITDRKRAEDELATQRRLFLDIMDGTPSLILALDRDQRITFVNEAGVRFLRTTKEALQGRRPEETSGTPRAGNGIPPEVARGLAASYAAVMATGEPHIAEVVVPLPGGDRTLLANRFPLRDAENRIYGIASIATDVTTQQRIQEDLRRSEQRLEILAEASKAFAHAGHDQREVIEQLAWRAWKALGETCHVALVSDDGGWLETAAVHSRYPALADALGTLGPERTESSPLLLRVIRTGDPAFIEVAPPECLRDHVSAQLRRLYEPYDPHSAVVVALRAQGRTLGVLTLTRYRGGRSAFTEADMGLARELGDRAALALGGARLYENAQHELAERKRAEAEREQLSMAIEQAAEEVVVTDAEGTILYVNPVFEAVTGYTRAEALGQNPRLLKSGVQDEAFYRVLWETVSKGNTWHGRLVNKKKDGTRYTEEATISPVKSATGIITNYVAVKRDISRELGLEEQLFQAQKMEGIGRLAGGVAHDFNNLLSVILSCTAFVLDALPAGDPLRDDVAEIEKAGRRAATLTRQLLAFSRKQVLQPEALDLNRVVAETEKMLRRILGEDIDLVQVLAPDLGVVKADPGQLEQVIVNLAVNARDAMPEGGKLTIETANVEFDADDAASHAGSTPGPHVMFAVGDTGIGMDQGTMERVFEPFFTTKAVGKGTGLGLATVYGIVKQSGGSIYVYSEPGKGTTFKVYLPRESAATPVDVREPTPTLAGGAETILVVEDDEAVRSVATRILGAAGYKVLTAGNGREGLLVCDQHPQAIHLVLTDVVMPFMGGRALAEHLALAHPGIKVLYMSGYTDNAITHHGALDKGIRFIGKPLTQAELLRKVRDALDG